MQPQLVMQDFGGKISADIEAARSRLIRGGSWKKQRVVVLVPASDLIPSKVALAYWNLMFPPNQPVVKILALGQEVGEAYSNAIDQVLSHPELSQWEYLLTMEHDNMPPADGAIGLIEAMESHPQFACIGGLYFTKGAGGVAQIWGDPSDPAINFRPQVPQLNTVQECVGCGMGFNIWRLKMFKDERLRRPWFKTVKGAEGIGTQDLYFWGDARKYGYRCAVDTRVRVGHYDVVNDEIW